MRSGWTAVAIGLLLASAGGQAQTADDEAKLDRWNSPRLTRFRSEAEFRRYLRDFQAARSGASVAIVAPLSSPPPPPPAAGAPSSPPPPPMASQPVQQSISALPQVVPSNPAITNVQELGVDEGDIVKQVGQYLLVLQDGRVFSIDTQPGGAPGLALADRFNVYREDDDDAWYDEMLVYGDRVVVTGYSYDEEASQITVMRVGADGRLRDEGTFFLSSNDYYDEENYATRLVGDRLIIYTPIALADIDLDTRWEWPVVRRWRREEARERPRRGRPIVDARSVYRPAASLEYPVLHTVSVCRLGEALAGGDELGCRGTALIGPSDAEMYVTPTDAWLWASGDIADRETPEAAACPPAGPGGVPPALLYRLPLSGRGARVAGVRGEPIDQLSLAVIGNRFHALAEWDSGCGEALTFATIPLARFGRRLEEVPAGAYVPVPEVSDGAIENRFTDRYLVYGGRSGHSSFPPNQPAPETGRIVIVPVERPAAARALAVPHSVLRAERAGSDIVLTGYRDASGLDVSLVDLDAEPRIASTVRLDGRYETEGRSHAFNSSVGADGSGLLGVPTAPRVQESGRWVSRSGASDVSFLSVDAAGSLAPLGELERGEEEPGTDYRCEVSCVDWYGNSRPIFTGGRVFALSGTELVEGRVEDGRVREIRRLDLTAAPPRR